MLCGKNFFKITILPPNCESWAKNPEEDVETLLNEASLALGEFRMIGKTTEKKKPFVGLVEAVKI